MQKIHELSDIIVTNKTVFLRADFNVPLSDDGKVLDLSRISCVIPTIEYLVSSGAKVLIYSHLGRPNGKNNGQLSLHPIASELARIIDLPVKFVPDCIGDVAENAIANAKYGDILLMENLRFYKEEKGNDPTFAHNLSHSSSVYVNEAFSCSHRCHASIVGVANLIRPVAGFATMREIFALKSILQPNLLGTFSIVGGSKIGTKLDVLKSLAARSKYLFLGGGMANSFLYHAGKNIGKSIYEDNPSAIEEIYAVALRYGCEIILPLDVVVSNDSDGTILEKNINSIESRDCIYDVGSKTTEMIKNYLTKVGTVLCNGPMGYYEKEPFHLGTLDVLRSIALLDGGSVKTVIGGGDTIACAAMAGVMNKFSFVSHAGGAFLEFISDIKLPGIECLISRSASFEKSSAIAG